MATLTINNTNTPTTMRLRLTYTSGQGNITITKIEGCRTDAYTTSDNGSCTISLKVGTTTKNFTKTGVHFNANSSYSTIVEQSTSFDKTGTQNVQITFTSANSNINNSSFTTTIDAGVKVPTLTINNASSSNRLNITTSGASLNYTLANTNSISTSLQYYVGSWKTFESKSANGTYTYSITSTQASEIITYFNTTANPNLQLRANNTNGTSSVVYAYLTIDSSIVPTLTSISVFAHCSIIAFDGLFIKGLSKPVITFNGASGANGSTISSYMVGTLTGESRTDFILSMTNNVSNLSNFNVFSVEGTNSVTAYVKDSRSRTSTVTTETFTVIDYANPSLISVNIQRCLLDGTVDEDGTYGKLTVSYKVSPVFANSIDNNIKNLYYSLDNENWTSINIVSSDWTDTITEVIGGGNFSTANTYTIYVKLGDRVSDTIQFVNLSPSKRLISRYHGNDGEGVTLGRRASGPGFHDYLGADFHNGLKINGVNVLEKNIITATISGDVSLTNSSDTVLTLVSNSSVGSKLSVSSGKIVIGSGVSKVLISGKANFNSLVSSTTQRYFKIKQNNTEVAVCRTASPNNTNGLGLIIPPQIIPVQPNDLISASIQGVNGDVCRETSVWTYVTVEVVA